MYMHVHCILDETDFLSTKLVVQVSLVSWHDLYNTLWEIQVLITQVDALLEDRRVRMDESQALHDRETARIHSLSDQLHTTQSMLYDSTKDYLDLKYEFRSCERAWMAEKDRLLSQLDHYREQLDTIEGVDPLLGKAMDEQGTDVYSRYVLCHMV